MMVRLSAVPAIKGLVWKCDDKRGTPGGHNQYRDSIVIDFDTVSVLHEAAAIQCSLNVLEAGIWIG